MKLNIKQPKYVLPLIALPFLCLFFYVYHSSAAKEKTAIKHLAGINNVVGDVSPEVKKKNLEDKLDAYRNRFKETDGHSAVSPIPSETAVDANAKRRKTLDSIDAVMKQKFRSPPIIHPYTPPPGVSARDKQLAEALNNLSAHKANKPDPSIQVVEKEKDPMEIFKKQMAYMDSMRKVSDPAYLKQQQQAKIKAEAAKSDEKTLAVVKADQVMGDFNTVMPQKDKEFITAMIDENITGYAGSRIRLKLLEAVKAGNSIIPKDTYLYALISGFSGQRVTLTIKNILFNGALLPVKLEIYDQDGLPGLYVPDSQFRDFTKELGTNSMQGVSLDNGSSTGSQFLMSTADKMFESTSTAIASAIRKNKAKIKYNSYIYLIDTKNSNQ